MKYGFWHGNKYTALLENYLQILTGFLHLTVTFKTFRGWSNVGGAEVGLLYRHICN